MVFLIGDGKLLVGRDGERESMSYLGKAIGEIVIRVILLWYLSRET